jgi:uncharacterized membrane protein
MTGANTDTPLWFASTVLAGSLTGMELASWAVVHPAIGRLKHLEQVHVETALYRRFAQVQAPQMAIAVTLSAATAATSNGATRRLAAGSTGCMIAMLAVTFAGNMPINAAVLRWEESADPGRWRALRRRWDRLHTVRVLLDTTAFAMLVAAGVTRRA